MGDGSFSEPRVLRSETPIERSNPLTDPMVVDIDLDGHLDIVGYIQYISEALVAFVAKTEANGFGYSAAFSMSDLYQTVLLNDLIEMVIMTISEFALTISSSIRGRASALRKSCFGLDRRI